jgi:DNA replication protein DnaC
MNRLPEGDQRRDPRELIDDRYQRGLTVPPTQIALDRRHEQIGAPTYADAILDRMLHTTYRIELRGGSMRQRWGNCPQTTSRVQIKT